MNGSSGQAILDVDNVCENLQQFPEKLRVIRDSSGMDGRAIIGADVVLNKVEFLEMVQERHVSDQKIIVVL